MSFFILSHFCWMLALFGCYCCCHRCHRRRCRFWCCYRYSCFCFFFSHIFFSSFSLKYSFFRSLILFTYSPFFLCCSAPLVRSFLFWYYLSFSLPNIKLISPCVFSIPRTPFSSSSSSNNIEPSSPVSQNMCHIFCLLSSACRLLLGLYFSLVAFYYSPYTIPYSREPKCTNNIQCFKDRSLTQFFRLFPYGSIQFVFFLWYCFLLLLLLMVMAVVVVPLLLSLLFFILYFLRYFFPLSIHLTHPTLRIPTVCYLIFLFGSAN